MRPAITIRHPGTPRTVIDRVVSSYTPTVRALLEARRPLDQQLTEASKLLVVALTDTPGSRCCRP